MKNSRLAEHPAAGAVVLIVAAVLCGCPAADQQVPAPEPEQAAVPPTDIEVPDPETQPPGEPIAEPIAEPIDQPADQPIGEPIGEPVEQPADEPLDEPAVEPAALKPLDEQKPVWIDQKNGRVVMVGQICQTDTPLEMFACLKDTKEHEAIVVVDVKAFVVHAGLLAIGANTGHPVRFDPQYVPAAGSEIDVTVHWKDTNGKVQTARAQDWILDAQSGDPMNYPWVFAGSGFWQDEQTGQKHYQAEGGDFICVSNFSTAMLDLPIKSSQANNALMFTANSKVIPPRGTPVTLVLTVAKQEAPGEEKEGEEKEGIPGT